MQKEKKRKKVFQLFNIVRFDIYLSNLTKSCKTHNINVVLYYTKALFRIFGLL